jgi:heme exporter protein C
MKMASPKTCYRLCAVIQPWVIVLCLTAFIYGLIDGLWLAPPDYQQGDAYRIIFLHVPAAIMSLMVYVVMAAAVILHFIWKIKVADIVAKSSAKLGMLFTLITLMTGSLWGKPTWGTFWIWDARLTSELILLFIYFGIIALRTAIPEPMLAARASGLMTLIGLVNIPIIHYSVNWWHTLHQGATLLQLSKPTIAPSMLHPLLIMIAAYLFYFIWMLVANIRSELLIKEKNTMWVKNVS